MTEHSGNLRSASSSGPGFDSGTEALLQANKVQTTGILEGGVISQASSTTVNWASGHGQVANYANPEIPVITKVVWPAVTGQAVTNVATDGTTLFGYDATGNIVEKLSSALSILDGHNTIWFGSATHLSGAIVSTLSAPGNIAYSVVGSFVDFINLGIGPLNIDGNIYGPNGANMTIDVIGGNGFMIGSNFRNDPKIPDTIPLPSVSALSFWKVYKSAGAGLSVKYDGAMATIIDPSKYDDGTGTLATTTASYWTIQRIFRHRDGVTYVAYGQEEFATKAAALSALGKEAFIEKSPLPYALFRCSLVVQQGSSVLNNTTFAEFFAQSSFRLVGAQSASATIPGVTNPGGSDGSVQINSSNTFYGDTDFTYDKTTKELTTTLSATSVLADGVTSTTQSAADNSTKPATTKYVDNTTPSSTTVNTIPTWGATDGSLMINNSTVSLATGVHDVTLNFKPVSTSGLISFEFTNFADQDVLVIEHDDIGNTLTLSADNTTEFSIENLVTDLDTTLSVTGNASIDITSTGANTNPPLKIGSTGTNGATIAVHASTVLPNGVITGNPGDLCVVKSGTSSKIYQQKAASAGNTGWGSNVSGPSPSVANSISVFSDTTGQVINDIPQILAVTGATDTDLTIKPVTTSGHGTLDFTTFAGASRAFIEYGENINRFGIFVAPDTAAFEIENLASGVDTQIFLTGNATLAVSATGANTNPPLSTESFGTNGAKINLYNSIVIPNGVITGNPGDVCFYKNGINSRIYQRQAISAGNTGWVSQEGGDVSGPGSSVNKSIAIFDSTSGDSIDDFPEALLTSTAGTTRLELVAGANGTSAVTFCNSAGMEQGSIGWDDAASDTFFITSESSKVTFLNGDGTYNFTSDSSVSTDVRIKATDLTSSASLTLSDDLDADQLVISYNNSTPNKSSITDTSGDFTITSTGVVNFGSSINLTDTDDGFQIDDTVVFYSNEDDENTSSGQGVLASLTSGVGNVGNGVNSLYENTEGSYNNATGVDSLTANTVGNHNTADGYGTLPINVLGRRNSVFGALSGTGMVSASNTGQNTFVGFGTGNDITTGVNNTIVGANVSGLSATLSNNIILADGEGNQRINVDDSGNTSIGAANTAVSKLKVVDGSSGTVTEALRLVNPNPGAYSGTGVIFQVTNSTYGKFGIFAEADGSGWGRGKMYLAVQGGGGAGDVLPSNSIITLDRYGANLNDNKILSLGTDEDFTMSHTGVNTFFDNTFATGATIFGLGSDTTATKFEIRNDSGDSIAEFFGDRTVNIPVALTVNNLNVLTEYENTITVAKSGGDFTSIKTAYDSATTPSATNRYLISVYPGVYTEAPITLVPYVDLVPVGSRFSTKITASNTSTALFTGSGIGPVMLSNLVLDGVTTNAAVYNNTMTCAIAVNDCQITDCQYGIHVNNGAVFADGIGTTGTSSMTNMLRATGGLLSAHSCTVQGGGTFAAYAYVDGAELHLGSIHLHGANITTAIHALGAATVDGNNFLISKCTTAVKLEDTTDFSVGSLSIGDLVTNHIEVVDSTVVCHITSGEMDSDKFIFPASYSGEIISFIDHKEGDEGQRIFGELGVGRPERGNESVFGEGDSYTRGMLVYTENTSNVFVDVSDAARSASGSTFTFTGTAADNSIYIASSLSGADVLEHYGIKTSTSTACVIGSGEIVAEYWTGAAWTEFNAMEADSSDKYLPNAKNYFQETGSHQTRYTTELTDAWTKNDPMTLGTDYYWVRFRIKTAVTTAPVFEQFKLHTNKAEINAGGYKEGFGSGRSIGTLPWSTANLQAWASSPTNQDLYTLNSTDGGDYDLGVGRIENELVTGVTDKISFGGLVPLDIDTSSPVRIEVYWVCNNTTAGDVYWKTSKGSTSVGDTVGFDTGTAPTAIDGYEITSTVEAVGAGENYELKRTVFEFDVSEIISRYADGSSDALTIAITRDGADESDTYAGNVAIFEIRGTYVKCFDGGHI